MEGFAKYNSLKVNETVRLAMFSLEFTTPVQLREESEVKMQ